MKTSIIMPLSLAAMLIFGCGRDSSQPFQEAIPKKESDTRDAPTNAAASPHAGDSKNKRTGCVFLDKLPKGKGGDVLMWADAGASDGKRRKLASLDTLSKALENGDEETRLKAVLTLSAIDDSSAVPALRKALSDSSQKVRFEAVVALGGIDDPAVIPVLAEALNDDDGRVRDEAIASLGDIRDKAVIPVLINALESEYEEVVDEAVLTLEFLTGEKLGKDAARWGEWLRTKGGDFELDIEN